MTQLSKFFLNEVPDNKGRFLNDMLKEDFTWMEETHDFVQWWFPNTTPSNYNKDAPILTEQDIHDICTDIDAKLGFMTCVDKMLQFFGVAAINGEFVILDSRRHVLCGEFNHNHMRFTRVLLAMYYFGFKKSARKIFDVVSQEATEKSSIGFWSAVVEDNSR